jgi:hypothetical protein
VHLFPFGLMAPPFVRVTTAELSAFASMLCSPTESISHLIVDVFVQVRDSAAMGTATAIMVVCEDNA